VNPSPRRSAIQASRIASSSFSRAAADSTSTKRHGWLWCGAGAVSAVATARRTASDSTGSPVNARMVRRASGTSADPNRNMSSWGGRISALAPGPSSPVTRPASPRTTATGTPRAFPFTRSAAAATSSATAATVTSRMLPKVSASPRWSRNGITPAAPMALSVWPARHGRPIVSVTTTPTLRPVRECSALRSRRADSSGSAGSRTTVPGAVLDSSTPAAASTKPCRVCAIVVAPRLATTRAVSASMACSREVATTRPSALLTIFDVTTRMSPSRRSPIASAMSAGRSLPAVISGSPVTAITVMVLASGLTLAPPLFQL
jgi:hypothetical protein